MTSAGTLEVFRDFQELIDSPSRAAAKKIRCYQRIELQHIFLEKSILPPQEYLQFTRLCCTPKGDKVAVLKGNSLVILGNLKLPENKRSLTLEWKILSPELVKFSRTSNLEFRVTQQPAEMLRLLTVENGIMKLISRQWVSRTGARLTPAIYQVSSRTNLEHAVLSPLMLEKLWCFGERHIWVASSRTFL